jgi:hypothetical protein
MLKTSCANINHMDSLFRFIEDNIAEDLDTGHEFRLDFVMTTQQISLDNHQILC